MQVIIEMAEEKKKKTKKKDKKKQEKLYTIPLRAAFDAPRTKRAKKAVRIVQGFLMRHTKVEDVKIDSSVNEAIWERGIQKPPRKIKVKVTKEMVTVTGNDGASVEEESTRAVLVE